MTVNPGTPWPATDALGRKLPMPDEVGPPVSGRFVGIFYFLWHNRPESGNPDPDGPNDITKILARDPDVLRKPNSPLWKPTGAYYWGEALYGCDFMVNRTMDRGGRTWLEKNLGGWRWQKVAPVDYRVAGNELHLAIPRSALGLAAGKTRLALDFKWADNIQIPGDVMDFYLSGDVAPEGRFMYRYVGD
jgi:hypothetical protein